MNEEKALAFGPDWSLVLGPFSNPQIQMPKTRSHDIHTHTHTHTHTYQRFFTIKKKLMHKVQSKEGTLWPLQDV